MQTELVDRARRGDREAFGVLAGGAVDRLYAIARLILRDTELAEDATQDALVRAWRDLPVVARRRAVRCLALPAHRPVLRGHRAPPPAVARRDHRAAGRTGRARSRFGARRPRPARAGTAPSDRCAADDPRPALLRRPVLRARRPTRSTSPSGPPSPGSTTPSRRFGRPLRPTSEPRPMPCGRAEWHECQTRPRTPARRLLRGRGSASGPRLAARLGPRDHRHHPAAARPRARSTTRRSASPWGGSRRQPRSQSPSAASALSRFSSVRRQPGTQSPSPSPTPTLDPATLRWAPARLELDWPVPVRSEPPEGAPVLPMGLAPDAQWDQGRRLWGPFAYADPVGDVAVGAPILDGHQGHSAHALASSAWTWPVTCPAFRIQPDNGSPTAWSWTPTATASPTSGSGSTTCPMASTEPGSRTWPRARRWPRLARRTASSAPGQGVAPAWTATTRARATNPAPWRRSGTT